MIRPLTTGPRYAGLRVTREEYLDLDEDPDYRYDVIDGVMHVSPSPNADHSGAAGEFFFALRRFLEVHPVGKAYIELDVLLPDGGDPLRPDIQFIATEHLNIVKNHVHGTPDLVVEILSDSTDHRDLGPKSDRYLQCGVQEYWILDPRNRTLRVRYNEGQGEDRRWNEVAGERPKSRLLDGFQVTVKQIFG